MIATESQLSVIHDAVLQHVALQAANGTVAFVDGVVLLDVLCDMERAYRRAQFWRGVRDGLTLGPLRRLVFGRLCRRFP